MINTKKPTAHFLIGRHPVDLLRLAIKTSPATEKPLLICMTEGTGVAPLALGQHSATGYPGLAGLLNGERADIVRTVSCEGRTVNVVFPASAAFDSPSRAELIDRVRSGLDDSQVVFLIDTARISQDMPPLLEGDTVRAMWELRDPMEPSALAAFQNLRTRLDHDSPAFAGIQLYARSAAAAEEAAERAEEIREFSGISCEEVIVLETAPAKAVVEEPTPLEIVGVLARKLIHNLGNDLTCIAGNAQTGARKNTSEEDRVQLFGDIQKSVERIGELVHELRDARERLFSKVPTHTLGNLRDAVASALRAAGDWKVTLEISIPGNVSTDNHWLAYTVRSLIATGHEKGSVAFTTANRSPGGEIAAAIGFPVLEITGPVAIATTPAEKLHETAAEEYLRSLGGWVERAEGKASISIPLSPIKP
jgi:signal transduction histidine kinase